MKKLLAVLMVLLLACGLTGCGNTAEETPTTVAEDTFDVAYVVNGNLGDKSFFDSAEAGLETLQKDGRITLKTIELGGTEADQPKWLSTLYEVADSGEYDLIICGTYQMPDYLKEVAAAYPEQKFVIFDDNTYVGDPNVVNITYKQNELGFVVGVFAGLTTLDTTLEGINEDKVIGFAGGVDSPVINDFLVGYIQGAQTIDPEIKVDARYTNDYVDTSIAKEFAVSMINDNKCDIIWGVAGNAGNGAAETILELGKGYFIGVDSDQELTLSPDLAAITLTSGLKNVGNSLIWLLDEMDAGREYWGTEVSLGLADGGVGVVTDKNFTKFASQATQDAVNKALDDVKAGTVKVVSAFDANFDAVAYRDAAQPK